MLFFILYFFEGAPIGLVWWAIPTLMASSGVTVDVITAMTAMAALPWTFKFLLGPMVDRFLFTQRAYALGVAGFQLLMLGALVAMLFSSISEPIFFWLTLVVSLFSATQDVLIDAWAIGVVPEDARGRINGAMQAGLLSGRWLFGAGLLIALAHLQWQFAVGFLCALLLASILFLVWKYARNLKIVNPRMHRLDCNSFSFVWSRKFILLAAVAILTGFAFESFGAVAGPFLISHGFTKEAVGGVLSAALLAMLLGALLGGRLSDRLGARRVFLVSGTLLCGLVSGTGLLGAVGQPLVLVASVCAVYFAIGAFTASSYAFYMANAKGPMEATRFTFLMAMTNLCESSAAFSIGRIAATPGLGYAAGFLATSVVSAIGLFVLWQGFGRTRLGAAY